MAPQCLRHTKFGQVSEFHDLHLFETTAVQRYCALMYMLSQHADEALLRLLLLASELYFKY
jgi:hypothetical protein